MNSEIKTFKSIVELGVFLRNHRRLQKIKLEDASKILLIKKDILNKFEIGDYNVEKDLHLKGFLNSYIKYLNLEELCKLEIPQKQKISSLEKSNLQLESAEPKKNKYSSIIILLSLIIISLIYLFWNKKTYLNLYLIGSYLD